MKQLLEFYSLTKSTQRKNNKMLHKFVFRKNFLLKVVGEPGTGKSEFLYDIKRAVRELGLPYAIEQVGDHTLSISHISITEEEK